MKILYICNEYPPLKHGGIGTFTRDIAEGLLKHGYQVYVWGLYENIYENKIEKINGVIVFRVKYKPIFSKLNHSWFVLLLNLKLRVFLRKNKFDIVECQEWNGLLPFGLKKNTLVIRLHGASIFFDKLLNRSGNRVTHWLEKQTIKNSKNLVAVSEYCGRKTLEFTKLTNKKYIVIYNGVDYEKINQHKASEYIRYSIVFANSLLPKKGVYVLAKAFNIINDKYPKSTLKFIGKTGYNISGKNIKDLILDQIEVPFKKNVCFSGWVENHEDVYKQLALAHVCCYPSLMEGFGIAPVEAMALGKLTVYMIDGPGPEVIEDKKSGFLINSLDFNELANTIISIFDQTYNDNAISDNAEQRVRLMFNKNGSFIDNNISYYKKICDEI